MKIIGVGFGRTGTLSTCTALNQLGYPCYHMFEVLENPANKTHLSFWNRVAQAEPGSQHDWHEVFENYQATVDNPACCVWRELAEHYPDAKVILTLHPKGPEAWYHSTIKTIYRTAVMWQFRVLAFYVPKMRTMMQMCDSLIWERSHRSTMDHQDQAVARYNEHIEEVKAAIPEDRLLIFSADQGWDTLCSFLGEPIPEDDFPNVNDSAEFQAFLNKMCRISYVMLGITVLLLVGIGYALINLIT